MNIETINFIERLANEIREVYHIEIPIKDIDEVVRKLDGKIEYIDNICFSDFFDGTIKIIDEHSFLIRTPTDSIERKNFTIAHEIGHLFLHMGYIILPEIWNKGDRTKFHKFDDMELEYQAHRFASAFLMPKDKYIKKIKEYSSDGRIDIKEVARYFNVSMQAATNRGVNLGMIG